ncbi:zinc-ribbon domain-containing protein [Streptomyces sp. NPDC000594]|uniref:zinc-ribbon domain-containing protein n=1 Tax=Streptomyces sp. NPDC000594 TaxID=3154261 RepID=UPI0033174DED
MIIFGTKGYLHQLAVLTLVCGFCGNPSAHTLRKRVTKFTLFFVPLFPVSTKYGMQCTFCAAEQKLTGEQADQLLAQSAAGMGMGTGGPQGPGGIPGHGGMAGPGGGQGMGQPPRNPYQK